MLYAIVSAILLIADQWLKYWVTVNITLATGEVSFIPGVMKLVNIHNDGAAFSFLSGISYAQWLFLALAVLFIVLIIIMLARHIFPSPFVTWCGALAMTGAIGNCIDRLLYGYVVDMFKLEFVNFAVFNIADVILVVSCMCFIIYLIVDAFSGKNETEKKKEKQIEITEEYSDSDIDVSGIQSDAPDFPEDAAPLMSDSVGSSDLDFWAAFKSDIANKPSVKPAALSKAERVIDLPAEKAEDSPSRPVLKQAPEDEVYSLEDILSEFQ